MTVDDIVDEVLEEFDFVSEDARESAYSFAGTGPFTSEVIDFPSGSIIAEIEYLSNADYDMHLSANPQMMYFLIGYVPMRQMIIVS
jgi:hypothetical protein